MNPVPCQEYSQVRQHVDHCPDQEDTSPWTCISEVGGTASVVGYLWGPASQDHGHHTELRSMGVQSPAALETLRGRCDPKSMIGRSKETHSSTICPEKTSKHKTKPRLGTAGYLMAVRPGSSHFSPIVAAFSYPFPASSPFQSLAPWLFK